MSNKIINMTLLKVIKEIENLLGTYPENDSIKFLSGSEFRQKIIAYVLSRTSNRYRLIPTENQSLNSSWLLEGSTLERLEIENLIFQGISKLLNKQKMDCYQHKLIMWERGDLFPLDYQEPTGLKFLVIEPDGLLRESLLDWLEGKRFQAIGTPNGWLGLQLVRQQMPDLIFCDLSKPELNGYEVLRGLRQDPATARIPLIFITYEYNESDHCRAMELGADDYLTKPLTARQLSQAIQAHIVQSQSDREHQFCR
jgi:CheY-like chemotaxis protein